MEKKFDICLMNPPYDHHLHEKFLEKTLNISNIVVSVQPSAWLIGERKNKKICDILNNTYTNVELINGSTFFDAGIGSKLLIINTNNHLSKTIIINNNKFENVYYYTQSVEDTLLDTFRKKIEKQINETLHEKVKLTPESKGIGGMSKNVENRPNNNWLIIKIQTFRGNLDKSGEFMDDFYTIISKDNKYIENSICYYRDLPKVNKKDKQGNEYLQIAYIVVNNKEQAYNFINYIKTDFVRACLKVKKINGNIFNGAFRMIPWQNFSDEVFSKSPKEIDDYLFDKYNISNEIRKHIEEILPDYYNIRKNYN